MNLEGDDGTRPRDGTLLTARRIEGGIRVFVERVRRRGDLWEAWSPLTYKDYTSLDAIPEDDVARLGAAVLANIEASLIDEK